MKLSDAIPTHHRAEANLDAGSLFGWLQLFGCRIDGICWAVQVKLGAVTVAI